MLATGMLVVSLAIFSYTPLIFKTGLFMGTMETVTGANY
jgi:hypothetical protein